MQNQTQFSAETSGTQPYAPQFSVAEWETAQNEVIHAKVEDYLDRVCQPLIETAPYATRMEIRREIAQHLDSLTQAYQEMGDDPILATEKALEKFGEPERVARQWKPVISSTRRKPSLKRWFGKQWQGIASTLTVCSIAGVLFVLSRPIVPVSLQNSASTTLSHQEVQTTITASNFQHTSGMNTDCVMCHRSEMHITAPPRTHSFVSPRVVAPK